ncbi:PREDICTED: uncharacterized protein LOC105367595 [Ceratosolen solmsi marchali]|uniref:Uncharacterized protein LOC105367595 n=1 Tax=Ceratosolen solmsi marchali TaxID=326594 RepID=A0AAJ6YUM9_9HYME|nr:PREDICTED: uncharacterized protein LOC105367595 [Ceratosolen solmsi marchali]
MCSARSGNDSFYPPRHEKKRTNEYENRWDDKSFGKYVQRGEEEARYAKFVYDITQDIVRNGLYTDKELKEVFEKHLERSSRYLNKRKMLYEIYQLKISLNIMDDSEEDEIEADLVFAEKFSKLQIPKPPTPPKILNENKILEKLQSFKEQKNKIHKPNSSLGRKSVVLIDANPEFMVTERDVLSTLMDNHVDPEQIQRIYRHLFQRSKDMSLCEAVQVGKEVSYTHRLKQIDRGISTISLDNAYIKERLQGILRNQNKTYLDEISTQTMYYKNDYINNKRDEISETFEQLKNDECDCKLIKRIDYNEKEIQPSFFKIPIQKINSFNKKFNIIDKKIMNKRSELLKSRSSKIEYHQRNNVSENLQCLDDNSTDKNKNSSTVDNGDFYQIALVEENEGVEEEIESNISNLSEKSKMSSTTQKEDKSFNEDENKDDSTSIVSEMSHESLKYSDNFSNASESNSNIDINFITNVKLPLSVSKDKV